MIDNISQQKLLWISYLVLVLIHVAVIWGQSGPRVTPDEISYIAQARFFAGVDPVPDARQLLSEQDLIADPEKILDTRHWRYYHFGYSLLLAPIYYFADSSDHAYRAALIFNGFLLSSLFWIVYAWIRLISPIEASKAMIIACVTSLYPAYIVQAHVLWAENAMIPGVALSALLFTWFLKSGRFPSIVLFALVTGFLFAVHPRGLAVVLAAVICLIALGFARRDSLPQLTLAMLLLVSVVFATRFFAGEMAILMDSAQQEEAVANQLSSLVNLNVVPVAIGNVFYLVLASLGLFLLGVAEGVRRISRQATSGFAKLIANPATGAVIYVFVLSGITIALSVIYFSSSNGYAPEYVATAIMNGRYNEVFLSLFIALGFLWLAHAFEAGIGHYSKWLERGFWLVALAALLLSFYVMESLGFRLLHSLGLYPWSALLVGVDGWSRMAPVFVIPLTWSWLALQLVKQSYLKAILLVGFYFLAMDIWLLVFITPALQV